MTTQAYGLLLITTLSWAANTIFGRLAVGQVSPLLLVSLRWLLVTLVLTLLSWRTIGRDWPMLRPRLGFVAAMGALGFAGFNALYYTAAHSTTAVHIGIIQGAMPALVLIGASWVDRAPVGLARGFGVALSLVGVVVVATGGDLGVLLHGGIRRGDGFMLAASLLYAGYTVALRRRPAVSPLSLMAAMSAFAFVASLPLSLGEWLSMQTLWPTARGWSVIALIVVFPSLLAQVLYIRAVGLLGPGRAGMFVNLVPVFASALAVGVLDEPFALHHGIGLVLVVGGIVLSERAGVVSVSA